MRLKVIVHEAEEGGYWAEVPAIPGCATQGETFEELAAQSLRGRGRLSVRLMSRLRWRSSERSGDRDRRMKSIAGKDLARVLERQRMDAASRSRQSSHLRQAGQRRPSFHSDSRQRRVEDRSAESLTEIRRLIGKRSLT